MYNEVGTKAETAIEEESYICTNKLQHIFKKYIII